MQLWGKREVEKAQAMVLAKQAVANEIAATKETATARAREREWIPKLAEDVEASIIFRPNAGASRPIMFARSAKNRGMRITCARARRW